MSHREKQEVEKEIERTVTERMSRISSELAHDLRSPLQAIQNALYLIQRKPDNPVYHEMIRDSLDQAKDILDGFRDYYQAHILKPVESDLRRIYEVGKSSTEVPGNITLVEEIDCPERIKVDASKLSKVLSNIIKNAVQALPEGGVIRVKIKDEGDQISVSVSDNGPGISPEVQEVLFTPFESRKKKGRGLGLPAAKRIIEAHGGGLSYETKGEGTTFTFTLPKN